ncbi:helix-turn-helix domain-containing protein [Nocardioides kribbensis]|uniref:Helix-turn-helix domain-containing protein n=1 Tax=Nocardioides kribbensis TaxID=305517 RepID=A0ABV1NZ46_9ACTN
MSTRIWLNTTQAAEVAGCHRDTVLKALEAGELHGNQRKAKGRWRVHADCLDKWCAGEKCAHQIEVAA